MDRMVGVDFGTTNSALAVISPSGETHLARFQSQGGPLASFRSVLYFEPDEYDDRKRPLPMSGPQAIELYLDQDDGDGRLIQSMKTYLVSKLFHSTAIYGTKFTLEDLIVCLLADLKAEAEAQLGPLGDRVVIGRPVHLSPDGDREADDFAIGRLERAVRRAGFREIMFEYEPVAAAYHYERRLVEDELVLIADFGGGTSDFTLMRVGPGAQSAGRERVIGTHGVPLAGNAFDSQMVKRLIAPAFGLGSRYRSIFGKWMPVPPILYADLQWHRLSMLRAGDTLESLEEILRTSDAPEKLEAFIHVVRYNLGYQLYRAIERTKIELSSRGESTFVFEDEGVAIRQTITRDHFEAWIGDELTTIADCVDGLLAETGTDPSQVERVFMTGGSSFVPAVRRIFADRFGDHRIRTGDELTSVAQGLALRAAERDARA